MLYLYVIRCTSAVSSLSLAVTAGELRDIPGMGTFIETSHHDGTITRCVTRTHLTLECLLKKLNYT